MKKLFFLLSIFAIVLSCSSDETSTPVTPPPAPIVKYTITLSAGEGGTVSTTGGEYEAGQTVSVTATPQGEYVFTSWSDGNTNATRAITVSSNSTLTANFEKRKYPLTVNFDGEGEVIEEIVNSGRTTEYDSGTTVKLTAQAAAEWEFIGWTGDVESTEESVQIVIGEPKEVTATFEKKKYPLSVNIEGEGEVIEEIVEAGRTTDYDSGTTVKLTADPADEWLFTGWSGDIGDIDSTENPIQITLTESKTLTANFNKIEYFTLTVSSTLGGETSISGGTYQNGEAVIIIAIPKDGYRFIGWEGYDSDETSINITIESDINLIAKFEAIYDVVNLLNLLNLSEIKSKLNSECLISTNYNDFNFFISNSQPYINEGGVFIRTIRPDLVGWSGSDVTGNYFYFMFENNNLKYIDVYLNRSRIKIFYRSDYQSDEKILDDFTYYLNSTSFFSQTKDIKISSIKDGIYQSTGYIKQINYSQSIEDFKCINSFNKGSWRNHLNEKGDEYFKISNGNVTGRVVIYPSDYEKGQMLWQFDNYFYTDPFTGNSRDIVKINEEILDDFTINRLNLDNPISLIIGDQTSNIKELNLIKKIDPNELNINLVNSYEGYGFYADEIYSNIDFNDPMSYVEAFIKDASRNGVDLSYVNLDNFVFNIIPDTEWTSDAAAYASKICDNNQIEITFKQSVWETGKIPYKSEIPNSVKLMWHELGHDVLNLDHVCLGNHIMSGRHQDPKIVYSAADCEEEYITVYGMTWENSDPRKNFQRAVSDMFTGYEQIKFNCQSGKGNTILY